MENKQGRPTTHTQSHRNEVKEQRINAVARLFKRGYTFREIRESVMKELGLTSYSLGTVKKDVDGLLEEWRKERIADTDARIQLELQKISDVEREAWEAWEESKKDYEEIRGRQECSPTGKEGSKPPKATRIEQEKRTYHTCGDSSFLDVIARQHQERRKLLGLYAPEKRELTGKDGTPLLPPKEMTSEQIQEEIERIQKSRTT